MNEPKTTVNSVNGGFVGGAKTIRIHSNTELQEWFDTEYMPPLLPPSMPAHKASMFTPGWNWLKKKWLREPDNEAWYSVRFAVALKVAGWFRDADADAAYRHAEYIGKLQHKALDYDSALKIRNTMRAVMENKKYSDRTKLKHIAAMLRD